MTIIKLLYDTSQMIDMLNFKAAYR